MALHEHPGGVLKCFCLVGGFAKVDEKVGSVFHREGGKRGHIVAESASCRRENIKQRVASKKRNKRLKYLRIKGREEPGR